MKIRYDIDCIFKILAKVKSWEWKKRMNCKEYADIEGQFIRLNSTKSKLRIFLQKGTICAKCGLKASHFTIDLDFSNNKPSHVLVMYGEKYNEGKIRKIKFTVDHIVPKSKGGSNHIRNKQPMCYDCNQEKSNH